jgi:DNA-directed RNA polymerase III subunit RPC2
VTTRVLDMVHFDELPGGQNAIIAVMSYSGYDIEDATVQNKASLDRGFGRCMVTRKHVAHVKKYTNGSSDRIVGPPADVGFGTKAAKYAFG